MWLYENNRIRNEVYHDKLGVAPIGRSCGIIDLDGSAVKRRHISIPMRVSVSMAIRRRGRPMMGWEESMRKDLIKLNFLENMTLHRTYWRRKICVADIPYGGFSCSSVPSLVGYVFHEYHRVVVVSCWYVVCIFLKKLFNLV